MLKYERRIASIVVTVYNMSFVARCENTKNPKLVAVIKEIINPYDFVRIFDVIKKIEIIPIVVITAIGILAARVLILPKIIKEKLIIQNNKGGHSKKLFPLSFKLIQSLRLIISLAIDTYFVSSVSIKGYSPSCKKYNTKQSINKNADKNIL